VLNDRMFEVDVELVVAYFNVLTQNLKEDEMGGACGMHGGGEGCIQHFGWEA
jgi:hypothetical protein